MMTDPIADMLTRIRNANRIERPAVDMPASRVKAAIAQVLKDEGYILDFHVLRAEKDEHGQMAYKEEADLGKAHVILRVYLKYGPEGEKVIRHIERYSKPGRRVYKRTGELRPVLDGLGISVVSTSKGVMSDRRARAQRLGGEMICRIW